MSHPSSGTLGGACTQEELQEALPPTPLPPPQGSSPSAGSAGLGPVTLRGQDTRSLVAAPPAPLDCQA